MIKLQDFARECGVTDRAIQKHLKTYASELEGLYQRKGPNGTWLTEEACEILRSKMRQQPIIVGDVSTHEELAQARSRISDLEHQRGELALQVAALASWKAEKALEIAAADQTRLLLEAAQTERDELRDELRLSEAARDEFKAEAELKGKEATEAAEAAQKDRERAERAEAEKDAWARYAADLEAWTAMSWWARRKKSRPVPPEIS